METAEAGRTARDIRKPVFCSEELGRWEEWVPSDVVYFTYTNTSAVFFGGKVINAYHKGLNITDPYDIRSKMLPQFCLFPQSGEKTTNC